MGKKTRIHSTTKPVVSLPFFPLLSVSLNSIQPNLEVEMGTRAQKEHLEKPSSLTQGAENGACNTVQKSVFVFLHSIAHQFPNSPMMVAVGACRTQNSEGGEPSSLIGGVVIPGGWGQSHCFLSLSVLWMDQAQLQKCKAKWGNQSPIFLTGGLKRRAQGIRKH